MSFLKSWGNFFREVFAFAALISAGVVSSSAQISVTTYHYDNYRTGWNSQETVLTPGNVSSYSFGLLTTVSLDDQVDAQPLVVPNVTITAGKYAGRHDVAYVATESNTVYAIDVHTGAVLLNPNFGPPVPRPLGCSNNGPNVGINSTPVIDPTSSTLYVVVYNNSPTGPAYYIHALDLGSLEDTVTPELVTGSHTLSNGTTYTFNPTVQRQRPALVLANGNVYAGFGSFCDYAASLSRGWLLGWNVGTLTPLAANQVIDTQASSPHNFFLSSIWMSGYGPSVDDSGDLLFVTGNSDPSGTTYDGVTNIQESVVKVSADLTTVLDLFTPDNVGVLDEFDMDFGSGGALILPDQAGGIPHLAVAAGKSGPMYLMNEDDLGGFSSTGNNVLGTYTVGPCWCGQSYYVDPSDGLPRVVSSGGHTVGVWKLQIFPSPSLAKVSSSTPIEMGSQNGGFFTSVSSNGTANPIIWALSHPINSNPATLFLYAFDPEKGGNSLSPILTAAAGNWPNVQGNSNLVPVVANGRVFVASNKQLQIFGLKNQE
jgi:hypothetical protein